MTMRDGWARRLDVRLAEVERHRGEVLPGERAAAIADAVAEAGRGGRERVARHLGVSVGAVDQAQRRARDGGLAPARSLPADTLARVLALELSGVRPLPRAWWKVLVWVVRSVALDVVWLEQPGELLAQEVEDLDPADLDRGSVDTVGLAAACRSWTRVQALAVLDRCARADLDALPATDPEAGSV